MIGTILCLTRERILLDSKDRHSAKNIIRIRENENILALSESYTDLIDSDFINLKVLYQNKVGYISWFYAIGAPYIVVK